MTPTEPLRRVRRAAAPAPAPAASRASAPAADESAGSPTGSTGLAATSAAGGVPALPATDDAREVTIPAGTILHVRLETPIGSATSRVESPVRGELRRAVRIHGFDVLPAGTALIGHVTSVRRPGRVSGRGYVALRFTQVETPRDGRAPVATAAVGHLAPATKEQDALKIIAPAAGGAVLGRVIGGKAGARTGAVVGGAAGTGYVLSTRGKEARLGRGARLAVRLTAPLTIRVQRRR